LAVLRHRPTETIRLAEVDVRDRAPILRHCVAVAPGGRSHIAVDPAASLEEWSIVTPALATVTITVTLTTARHMHRGEW
jgi:hypothetical protein